MLGHHRHDCDTPFKWRFAGGPMMACRILLPLINKKKQKKKNIEVWPPLILNIFWIRLVLANSAHLDQTTYTKVAWPTSSLFTLMTSILRNSAPKINSLHENKKRQSLWNFWELTLSYDVASGSEITPCNKICKPLVVYRFTGNVMTSIPTLRKWQNYNVFTLNVIW